MIHLDIVRQGHNIKTNSAYIDAASVGKTVNKTVGPNAGSPKTKTLTIQKNP